MLGLQPKTLREKGQSGLHETLSLTNIGENIQNLGHSCTASKYVKWYSHFEKQIL